MSFIARRLTQWIRAVPGKPGHRGLWLPCSVVNYAQRMRGAQHYRGEIKPAPPPLTWAIFSGLTSFTAMAVLGMIQKYGPAIKDNRLPFAIAPAGASAVLIYGVPSAPLSQPRNVLVGHMIAAVTGICMNELFKHAPVSLQWLPGALAVGLSIALMGITNCYHPPAGATAYLAGYYSPDAQRVGWWFPLFPVLPVVLIMVSIGVLLNNLARIYPVYWFTAVHSTPPKPLHEPKVDVTQGTEPSRDNDSGSKPLRPLSSSSESGSECAVERASYVDDRIENEGDADYAWMAARISELEHELHELRAKQRQNEESHSPSCQPGHV